MKPAIVTGQMLQHDVTLVQPREGERGGGDLPAIFFLSFTRNLKVYPLFINIKLSII
jgi:hypothetical protein